MMNIEEKASEQEIDDEDEEDDFGRSEEGLDLEKVDVGSTPQKT